MLRCEGDGQPDRQAVRWLGLEEHARSSARQAVPQPHSAVNVIVTVSCSCRTLSCLE